MRKYYLCLVLVLSCTIARAKLEDHLKGAPNKGNNHSIRNIDFIYMINLDRRPEKYEMSKRFLEQYGIHPYRFSAVNGWELTLEDIQDIGLKYEPGMTPLLATTYVEVDGKKIQSHEFMKEYGKTYFRHSLTLGAMGCALSHISVLFDAYHAGYDIIWVMEDDPEVISDPHQLSDFIDELDALVGRGNWDVLFTDYDYRIGVRKYNPAFGADKRPDMDCRREERFSDKYTNTTQISKHFRKMPARFGTASMVLNRNAILKLLRFAMARKIFLPYDLENNLPPEIKRYGLMFDVVTNMLNPLSDIGVPDYLTNAQKMEGNKK